MSVPRTPMPLAPMILPRMPLVRPLLVLCLLALAACDAPVVELTLVNGGRVEVEPGQTRPGTIVMTDGRVHVHEGGRLAGGVVMLGGDLAVEGTVGGDIVAVAGGVRIAGGAVVDGDVRVGGTLERDAGAHVSGEVVDGPAVPRELADAVRGDRPSAWETLAGIVLGALAAGVAARVAPRATGRLSAAAGDHPLVSGALGLLALVVAIALAVLMAFTIVLIPVGLLVLAAALVGVLLGWLALGVVAGRALARAVRREWPLPRAALAGSLLVGGAAAVVERVPLLGATVPIVVSAVGFGAVLLTGFGLRHFVPASFTDDEHA